MPGMLLSRGLGTLLGHPEFGEVWQGLAGLHLLWVCFISGGGGGPFPNLFYLCFPLVNYVLSCFQKAGSV